MKKKQSPKPLEVYMHKEDQELLHEIFSSDLSEEKKMCLIIGNFYCYGFFKDSKEETKKFLKLLQKKG